MKLPVVIMAVVALALNVATVQAKDTKHAKHTRYPVRSLSDARLGSNAAELVAQQTHSQHVITFFRHHRWMLATHHRSCRAVPWSKTCRIARGQNRLHRWLHSAATTRYQRVMFDPSVVRQWVLRYHPCLDPIIQLENKSYDPTLDFGGGHGNVNEPYGIPQANPGTKMASAGADWRTNPYTQLRWMIGYVIARSGSECAAAYARQHSQSY